MAEKYLKLIQDGLTHYVPDNPNTRRFWANQNKRVGSGRNAAAEIVTIMPATDEEVEFMTRPVAESAANLQKQVNPESATAEQLAKMQAMIESQQALINKFLLDKLDVAPTSTEDVDKTKGKPGPKPKTEKDGKDETKVNTEA